MLLFAEDNMIKFMFVLFFIVFCLLKQPSIVDSAVVANDQKDVSVSDLFGTDEKLAIEFNRVGDKFLGSVENIGSHDERKGRLICI